MRVGGVTGFAVAALLACAAAAQPRPAQAAADPSISRLCGRVLGLSSGEAHFVACTEALSGVGAEVGRGRALAWARAHCLQEGLRPGKPELGVCELRAADRTPASPVAAAAYDEPPRRSYFMMSNAEVVDRVQLACAEMGLEPGAPAFGSCQAGLQAALFAADNPQH